MMWTEERPIPSQIVEVVHDDSHKQVEDLDRSEERRLTDMAGRSGARGDRAAHQESTETVKAQKIDDSKVGAAGELLPWLDVRFGVALLPIHGGHHDFLPLLSGSTSEVCRKPKVKRLFVFCSAHTLEQGQTCRRSHRNNIRTA